MAGHKHIWKAISTHPGYEVSECGEVREVGSDCFLSQHQDKNRLFYVNIGKDGDEIYRWVHVLVAEAFNGHPMGHKVIHKDGNTYNNRSDNLVWQPS